MEPVLRVFISKKDDIFQCDRLGSIENAVNSPFTCYICTHFEVFFLFPGKLILVLWFHLGTINTLFFYHSAASCLLLFHLFLCKIFILSAPYNFQETVVRSLCTLWNHNSMGGMWKKILYGDLWNQDSLRICENP